MKPEIPRNNQDRAISPHAQEIEYALILSRMINTVKDDPVQLRLTIYEFARARLKIDTSWIDEAEQKRLSAALETAIQGVEEFSVRRDEKESLQPPNPPSAQIGQASTPAAPRSMSLATVGPVTPAPQDILVPNRVHLRADIPHIVEVPRRPLMVTLARFCIGMMLFGTVATLAYHKQRLPSLQGFFILPAPNSSTAEKSVNQPPVADSAPSIPPPGDAKTAVALSSSPSFPLPGDYGIYALNNDTLSELQPLPERVPDKRIAMSTPINQASRTTLPDGKARFILFRRDLAGNAPDRVEVRVVARVARAITFDAKGKPAFSPVSDAWNIRNLSYELRVRPIAGNPEMLLVQSEKADFALPAGRYVLALRDQGYDFTVGGKVTDPAQCLERTDAANGEFYSECRKP
jgi:hypothetical protein